jgi:hypothetical protein
VHALDQRLALGPISADDRPTVFLLPGVYGFDSRLAYFSADCSHALRIIGVSYADWPEIVQPDVSFEKIVAGAVAFMTERAPTGPLLIAGQSYGGHVAYAAALPLLRLRPLALNYHLQQHFNYVLRVQLLRRWRPPLSELTLPVRCFVFRAVQKYALDGGLGDFK